VKNRFKSLPFKCNLQRYNEEVMFWHWSRCRVCGGGGGEEGSVSAHERNENGGGGGGDGLGSAFGAGVGLGAEAPARDCEGDRLFRRPARVGTIRAGTYQNLHAPMLTKVPKNTAKVPNITCSDAGECTQNTAKVPKIPPKYPK
jgi:hypothetical protein